MIFSLYRRCAKRSGMTMMEVLTGIILISIVSSVILPGITNFYSGTRVKAEAERFVSNVRFARYRAMQYQRVTRLIFCPDDDAYKVQEYFPDYPSSGYTESSLTDIIENADMGVEYYDNDLWVSCIDVEEVIIDRGVMIDIEATIPQIIYFWPDGFLVEPTDTALALVSGNKQIIPESHVTFTYGGAAIRVVVNAMGVFSSESYSEDNLDFDEIW